MTILALTLLLGGSGGPAATPSPCTTAAPSQTRVTAVELEAPTLAAYVDRDAARLLELVTKQPASVELRRQLASHYGASGRYLRAAEFFEFTAQFAAKGTVDVSMFAQLAPSLDCQIRAVGSFQQFRELDERVMAAYAEAAREVQRDQSREGFGLAAAEKAMRTYGAFCPLLAEWASAYLWQTAFHPEQADSVLRELSIRMLITLGEENQYPVGYEGSASVYKLISEMFRVQKDYIGGYVAVLVADERLRHGSLTGSIDETSFTEMLVQAIGQVKTAADDQRHKPR